MFLSLFLHIFPISDPTVVDAAALLPDNLPLDNLLDLAYDRLRSDKSGRWRSVYTDACLLRSLSDFIHGSPNDKIALDAIARLDRAIVIAGAPGKLAIILDLIQKIQMQYLPFGSTPEVLQLSHSSSIKLVLAAKSPVPRLEDPPSFTSFQFNHAYRPFILSGYVDDWPARNEHSWSSLQYLRSVAGRGRVVPVEVGSDYRANDWTQKMMDWHEFLDSLNSQAHPVLYLAQHSLFLQFPALREDIVVPDYVYSTSDHSEDFPGYMPPANDEQLVINAWLGPKGTISPAHTDPYHNLYAQVVGRKTVWLAPSHHGSSMNPFPGSQSPSLNPAANRENPSMSNTSQIDVFSDQLETENLMFWQKVVPEAMYATLEPGDLLYIPPGWWHAFRSEEVSFSVSMWF